MTEPIDDRRRRRAGWWWVAVAAVASIGTTSAFMLTGDGQPAGSSKSKASVEALTLSRDGSRLPAPTITSQRPAPETSATSASFGFTDSRAGVTFECSLDGSTFSPCTNPKTYPGPLAVGPHTFRVRAVSGSTMSDASSYVWTIDRTPPTPSVTGPASPTNAQPLTFVVTFSEAVTALSANGLTLTTPPADSARGLGVSRIDSARFAVIVTNLRTDGSGDGPVTLVVKAGAVSDLAGNPSQVSGTATVVWDRTPPPTPVLTSTPPNPAPSATGTFSFTDAQPGVQLYCSLDHGPWTLCTSPDTVTVDLHGNGEHFFDVRATDAAGNVSGTASYRWKVQSGSSGHQFTISGAVSGLTPGVWRTIAVALHNPNSVPIVVTALTVSVAADSTPSGCPSSANVQVQQAPVSTTLTVTVPANGTVTLPAQGVAAPQMRLVDLPTVNQDVCKGKGFALSYSGSAHS